MYIFFFCLHSQQLSECHLNICIFSLLLSIRCVLLANEQKQPQNNASNAATAATDAAASDDDGADFNHIFSSLRILPNCLKRESFDSIGMSEIHIK